MARRKSMRRWLMQLIFRLAVLGAALYGLAMGVIWVMETHPAPAVHNTHAIVVLGAQVYADGSLSPQLELRMEAALNAYQQNPRPIIACGAQGKNEPVAEGIAMRDWLIARGVPGGDVWAETNSFNTLQNLKNARELLSVPDPAITLVTSDYHLPRGLAIARDAGFEAEGVGSPCKPEYWLKNHAREVLAWGKYFLDKIFPLY